MTWNRIPSAGMKLDTLSLWSNPFGIPPSTLSLAPHLTSSVVRTGFSQAANTAKKTRSESQIAFDFRGFLSSFLEVQRPHSPPSLSQRSFPSIAICQSTSQESPMRDSISHGLSLASRLLLISPPFSILRIAEHILKEQAKNSYHANDRQSSVTFSTSHSSPVGEYRHINLQGAAIGNGAIDVILQVTVRGLPLLI